MAHEHDDEAKRLDTAFDSERQYLGSVYAKALLGVTEAAGNTEPVLDEFQALIDQVLNPLPKFEATLASPRVELEDKLAMLDKALAGKVSQELLRFLKVVARHGRLGVLRSMYQAARHQDNESRGRVEVEVKTAVEIPEELVGQIRSKLQTMLGAEVEMRQVIDPQVIGGLVIRVGDTVYDASIARRLHQIRHVAVEKTRQVIRQSQERFASGQASA